MKLSKEEVIRYQYLNLPVKFDAPKAKMTFFINGKSVLGCDIRLADRTPDFWVFSDVKKFRGKKLIIQVEATSNVALDLITQSDSFVGEENLYREKYRPQIHFSSRRGWINDPNGLVFYKGEYHLFYQHNPYGCDHGNMHWGHAVSIDLVHWKEMPDALEPDELGTIFSGSAFVDWNNTAGFQTGDEKVIVLMYTSAGGTSAESVGQPFTQSIAYSNDCGRTWMKYEKNPVLPCIKKFNRDPKVIWHESSEKWIMALYLDKNDYGLFCSKNLKQWEQLCLVTVPGASECPDFFELPVDRDPSNTKWVFWCANGSYLLGTFDGQIFKQEGEMQQVGYGGDSYAAQTWSEIPKKDGRRIQIAWLKVDLPNMPFNQQMTFPCELTLRTTADGIHLFCTPVNEIRKLHSERHYRNSVWLFPGENTFKEIYGDLFDIRAEFETEETSIFGFNINGVEVAYDAKKQQLCCLGRRVPLLPMDGKIRLQILVDKASIEIFGNDGIVYLPIGVILKDCDKPLEVFSTGGKTRVNALEVYELRSAWA